MKLEAWLKAIYSRLPDWAQRFARTRLGGVKDGVLGAIRSDQSASFYDAYSRALRSHERFEAPAGARPKTSIKPIAFYLPQFHPIPENDRWWGAGFTEWTNVTRALPQFVGHYQPRLPADLGFYDLRLPEVHRRQAELAAAAGIHGFCYYYYWFDGQELLNRPLEVVLENPDLKFPFCVCWANESWSRRWDGREADVLMQQSYAAGYEDRVFVDLKKFILDARYIRVDGKPMILVYRAGDLPSAKRLSEIWRDQARQAGIGELYLVLAHSFERIDPREAGFDAAVEFTPNDLHPDPVAQSVGYYNAGFSGQIFDYVELSRKSLATEKPPYVKYRGVCPSWDNEARKPGRGSIYQGSEPDTYAKWLEDVCTFTRQNFLERNRFVFINAWNEWAEGAYLEPDQRYGHAYLNRTRAVLSRF